MHPVYRLLQIELRQADQLDLMEERARERLAALVTKSAKEHSEAVRRLYYQKVNAMWDRYHFGHKRGR